MAIYIHNIFYVSAYMIDSFLYKASQIESTTQKSQMKVVFKYFCSTCCSKKQKIKLTYRVLTWVFCKCYVLCALIVLVQGEILNKHFGVLSATSKAKIKGEQIPQGVKEWFWIVVAKYLVLP